MNIEGGVSTDMRRRWIQDWAFAPMPYYPEEDWDIMIAGPDVAVDLFDMVERGLTPKDQNFLKMLYLTVGDLGRSQELQTSVTILRLIERGLASHDQRLTRWARRSRALSDFGGTVDYDLWCADSRGRNVPLAKTRRDRFWSSRITASGSTREIRRSVVPSLGGTGGVSVSTGFRTFWMRVERPGARPSRST